MGDTPYVKYSVISSDVTKGFSSNSSKVIAIDKTFVFGNFNIAFSLSDDISSGKWILQIDNPNILEYATFMLNDPMMLKKIFGPNISRGKKYRVTKSMISSLVIPIGDTSLIQYYSLIEKYFQQIYYNKEQNDTILLKLDIFSSIRLALSFELHQFKILQKFQISIFENWKNLVDQVGDNINALFEELLHPENLLINNVRRFQLLLNSFQQIIQNGLEAK